MKSEALPKIAEAAVRCERETGVPAELLVAQCALESGWLAHAPGNNCFGVKSYVGEYGRQLLWTTEWFTDTEARSFVARGDSRTATLDPSSPLLSGGRRRYRVRDWFATFETLADCFAKRAALFVAPAYAKFFHQFEGDHDLVAFISALARVYATDPNYSREVLSIVNESDVRDALSVARGLPNKENSDE